MLELQPRRKREALKAEVPLASEPQTEAFRGVTVSICPSCGAYSVVSHCCICGALLLQPRSAKGWPTTLLLCLFLGIFGAHRFYVGKSWSGFLWLLTFGLLGLGWLVDLAVILFKGFKDGRGLPVK
ncbi:MAG: TM2 domain-containing protein [Coriobacteriales bacterium]|jgi:hypothetical protein|nr:TM2 domain-containing protein [Coriobacteriales bacterium]